MAGAGRYRVAVDEKAYEAFCTVAAALRDAIIELEKLYAMSGKLDIPTQMKLKDLKERIEKAIADVC